MATYLIIDDESGGREILSLLLKYIVPDCEIYESATVDEGLRVYLEQKPDLVFLDVQMPHKNGFEFVHELVQLGEHPKVVFVTAYNQYAIQAIKASALDYLLKPINEDDLRFCLNRIDSLQEEDFEHQKMIELLTRLKMNHRLKINTRVGFEVINPSEILYCEADGNYTDICLTDGKKLTTSTTLGLIEQELPKDQFFRIGRSIVINLDYLKSVNRKERICQLKFDDVSRDLPLSLSRVQDLSKIF